MSEKVVKHLEIAFSATGAAQTRGTMESIGASLKGLEEKLEKGMGFKPIEKLLKGGGAAGILHFGLEAATEGVEAFNKAMEDGKGAADSLAAGFGGFVKGIPLLGSAVTFTEGLSGAAKDFSAQMAKAAGASDKVVLSLQSAETQAKRLAHSKEFLKTIEDYSQPFEDRRLTAGLEGGYLTAQQGRIKAQKELKEIFDKRLSIQKDTQLTPEARSDALARLSEDEAEAKREYQRQLEKGMKELRERREAFVKQDDAANRAERREARRLNMEPGAAAIDRIEEERDLKIQSITEEYDKRKELEPKFAEAIEERKQRLVEGVRQKYANRIAQQAQDNDEQARQKREQVLKDEQEATQKRHDIGTRLRQEEIKQFEDRAKRGDAQAAADVLAMRRREDFAQRIAEQDKILNDENATDVQKAAARRYRTELMKRLEEGETPGVFGGATAATFQSSSLAGAALASRENALTKEVINVKSAAQASVDRLQQILDVLAQGTKIVIGIPTF